MVAAALPAVVLSAFVLKEFERVALASCAVISWKKKTIHETKEGYDKFRLLTRLLPCQSQPFEVAEVAVDVHSR